MAISSAPPTALLVPTGISGKCRRARIWLATRALDAWHLATNDAGPNAYGAGFADSEKLPEPQPTLVNELNDGGVPAAGANPYGEEPAR